MQSNHKDQLKEAMEDKLTNAQQSAIDNNELSTKLETVKKELQEKED
jgi:hypothetical protein